MSHTSAPWRTDSEGRPGRTSPRSGALGLLGRACHRHRWITVIGWLAVVACLVTLRAMFAAAADNNFAGTDPGGQSQRA